MEIFSSKFERILSIAIECKRGFKKWRYESLMWPWPLSLNVSKTCQQPDVQVDLNIDNGAKAQGTVINQDFISDSEWKSVWNYG